MVKVRPLSATVVRSDGQPAAQPRNRPTSALLRAPPAAIHPTRGASPHGSRDTAADSSNEGARGRRHHPLTSSSSSSKAHSRPRPETAKPRRSSAAAAAIEESKSLIRQLFDLCDALHMDSALLDSLHRNLQSYSLSDTAAFQKMLDSVQAYRRSTVAVLKRIDTRERVVQCFEQFAEENFLNPLRHVIEVDAVVATTLHSQRTASTLSGAEFAQHHRLSSAGKSAQTSQSSLHAAAGFPSGRSASIRGCSTSTIALQQLLQSSSDALDEYVFSLGEGRLATLAAAGDAILQSLRQCTEALEAALLDWDASTESMLDDIVDDGAGGMSSVSSPTREQSSTASPSPPREVRLSAPPELLEASKHFFWRGTEYKAKMRFEEQVFGQLREHWTLNHVSRYSVVREHRIRKERLQSDNDAMQRFHDAASAKAREEFRNAAAIKIQAAYRGHQATLWFQMLLLKKRAVRSITSWWRTLKARRCFFVSADYSKSAIVVQRVWRGYCARKRLPHLLRCRRAAVKIQRWWRYWDSHFRMMVRQVQRQHVLYASTVVLRSMRRFVVLVRRRREQRLVNAVTVIQRWCRGRQAARRDWAQHMALTNRHASPSVSQQDRTVIVVVPHGQDYGSLVDAADTTPIVPLQKLEVGVQASPCERQQPESSQLPESPWTKSVERRSCDDTCEVPVVPSEFVSPGRAAVALVDCDRLFPSAILSEARWGRFADRSAAAAATADARSTAATAGQHTVSSSSAQETSATTTVHGGQAKPEEQRQRTAVAAVRIQCFWRCARARARARHIRAENARRAQDAANKAAARVHASECVAAVVAHHLSSRLVAAMRRAQARAVDPKIRSAVQLQRWWRRIAAVKRAAASQEQRELQVFLATSASGVPLLARQTLRRVSSPAAGTQSAQALANVLVAGFSSTLDLVDVAVTTRATPAAAAASPPQPGNRIIATASPRISSEGKATTAAAAPRRANESLSGGVEKSPPRINMVKSVDIIRSHGSDAVEALRRRKQAAVRIAQWVSRCLRSGKNRRSEKDKAARTIARAFRSYKLQRTYFVRRRLAAEDALRQREAAEAARAALVEVAKKNAALDILYWYQHLSCHALLRRLNAASAAILARPDRDASARKLQKFWVITREKLRTLRLQQSVQQTLAEQAQQEKLVRAAVRIQCRFRAFLHRQDLELLRRQFVQDRTRAVLTIQKHVRRWLAKNIFWQEKLTKLSMFRELQRLRQKEKTRVTSTSGILRPAPKHAW